MINLPDISDQSSGNIQVGKTNFNAYGGNFSLKGEIYTASCSDDNSIVKKILACDGGNKVLVVDAAGVSHASMVGDKIAESALKNNWSGIVINGYVRDVEALKSIPIGIFAKGAVPQKTNKKNHGFEDILISFGSVVMTSKQWIYIDKNGWLVSDKKLEL
tara:strand:+ start:10977 stop:11456 length:480 start_codon:yes stop_codon:yes gene_type:complete